MISNAITLAALTSVGFLLIYKKLPRNFRHLVVKYNLVFDILALIATYIVFGGTVTALIAAALVSIVVSVMLHIAAHPSDYCWLFDMFASVRNVIGQCKEQMKQLNQKYLDMKEAPSAV